MQNKDLLGHHVNKIYIIFLVAGELFAFMRIGYGASVA